ncbi:MAG: division/cell wall cluster transcriptional repressor MraZ [Parcubacteria group bacterium]|nr:division/cell wall cluster transcriptional repressor MraZ [Parcubacteria group bacterium]
MLIGEYIHTIDNKKRIAIPAKLRGEFGSKGVLTRGLDNCLFLYPQKEWEGLVERLRTLPLGQESSRGFVRLMLASASEVEIDNLGRILVPEYLKDYAGLSKKIIIAGVLNRIEVWDENKWINYKSGTEKTFGDIAEKLGGLGI